VDASTTQAPRGVIEVTVSNGEVTLIGQIDDRNQKHRIENIVDAVSGVHEIHNRIGVRRERQNVQPEPNSTGASSSSGRSNSNQTLNHS
jgi:hypothetical protein